jgi:hypothetical protein
MRGRTHLLGSSGLYATGGCLKKTSPLHKRCSRKMQFVYLPKALVAEIKMAETYFGPQIPFRFRRSAGRITLFDRLGSSLKMTQCEKLNLKFNIVGFVNMCAVVSVLGG